MHSNWFAYDIAIGNTDHLGAYLSETERDAAFADIYRDGAEVETYVLGIVKAADLDQALNSIRMGDWEEYTQLA